MNARRLTKEELLEEEKLDKMVKIIFSNKKKYEPYIKILDLCAEFDLYEAQKGLVEDFIKNKGKKID